MLKLSWQWPRFWMRVAGVPYCRRIATSLALFRAPPSLERIVFATFNPRGWIDPRATVWGSRIHLGAHVYIDKRTEIYQTADGGPVEIGDRVRIYEDTHILVGAEGTVHIGADSKIH